MATIKECWNARIEVCAREETKREERCVEERDLGYNRCTAERDDGYRRCCDWAPCSWFCKAWVWVSNIVCVVWEWVQNIVCVVTDWFETILCVAYTTATFVFCAFFPAGSILIKAADGFFFKATALGRNLIIAPLNAIAHPARTVGTLLSYFGGCPDERYILPTPLQIISHHGYTKSYAENTIQACRFALEAGATALEIDVCYTSDGQVVLWHDWDPDDAANVGRRWTGNDAYKVEPPDLGSAFRRPVIELTLAELRENYRYVRDARADSGEGVDTTIPTLDTFFEEAKSWRKPPQVVYLDIKMPADAVQHAPQLADKLCWLMKTYAPLPFVTVAMVPELIVLKVIKARAAALGVDLKFTWDVEFPPGAILNPWKYSAIDHATGSLHNTVASVGRPTPATLLPWRTYRRTIAYDIGQWNKVNGDPSTYNAGLPVDWLIAWTINDADEMKCLCSMGVSGIITDEIERLVGVVQSTKWP